MVNLLTNSHHTHLLHIIVQRKFLMPISITFGICAGFLYTYYYDQTVAKYLGESAVGVVSAVRYHTC